MKYQYHIIVIGAGSAGLTVASGATGFGAKTALIEKHKMGGDCLNYGCVPSKTFLRSAHLAKDITKAKEFALEAELNKVDIKVVMERVRDVIAEIAPHDSRERFESLGADVFSGEAKLIDAHTVEVEGKKLTGKNIVIATGSKPRTPNIKGLSDIEYHTNMTIFDIEKLPEHLIVIGGGPIGLELGQGFRHLGSEVTVIDHHPSLFPKDDPEVWTVMKDVFLEDGINLLLDHKVNEVINNDENTEVIIENKNGNSSIFGDTLLISAGRIPDTKNLNLEKIGVKTTPNGNIIVDRHMRTSIKNIFAAGDVAGPFQFTHMAGYQGVKIIPNALLKIPQKAKYFSVPWTTYTKPEVAHVGYTQSLAEKEGLFRDSVFLELNGNDRAKAENDRKGFLKMIIGKKGKLIGATLVGEKAGEMIGLASLAINKGMKATVFSSIILSYPTEAEIFSRTSGELMKRSFKPWMKKLIEIVFL